MCSIRTVVCTNVSLSQCWSWLQWICVLCQIYASSLDADTLDDDPIQFHHPIRTHFPFHRNHHPGLQAKTSTSPATQHSTLAKYRPKSHLVVVPMLVLVELRPRHSDFPRSMPIRCLVQ